MSQLREQLSTAKDDAEAYITKDIEDQVSKQSGPWYTKLSKMFEQTTKADLEKKKEELNVQFEEIYQNDLLKIKAEHEKTLSALTSQVIDDFAKEKLKIEKMQVVKVEDWLKKFLDEQSANIKNAITERTDKKQEYQSAIEAASRDLKKVLEDHLETTVSMIKSDDGVMRTNFTKLKDHLDQISVNYLKESRLRDSAVRQMESNFETTLRETKKQQQVSEFAVSSFFFFF